MESGNTGIRLRGRLIDSLYGEAMAMAAEARTYFDRAGREIAEQLDPMARVTFSSEALKVTTRLTQILSWLLTQRALEAGQITQAEADSVGGWPADTGPASLSGLPEAAVALIAASRELSARVGRIDDADHAQLSPALGLINRLELAF